MFDLPFVFVFVLLIVGGWYALEAYKVKHGYPVTGDDGEPLHRQSRPEDEAEIRRLKSENEQLHEKLNRIGERVATLERIATDKPSRLAAEIDALAALSDQSEEKVRR